MLNKVFFAAAVSLIMAGATMNRLVGPRDGLWRLP